MRRRKGKGGPPDPPADDMEITYDYEDMGDGSFGIESYGETPYQSVAQLKAGARKRSDQLIAKGEQLQPVQAHGRNIAKTFWGRAWCRNLEAHHDYESRLPRGRSYLRHGSVVDLKIAKGLIAARVSGKELYEVEIAFDPLKAEKWRSIVQDCAGCVGSVLELLSGKISHDVMAVMTDEHRGLFPQPEEIHMSCSCPDWANMCKHVAAALYGVGARLDDSPELFFVLRGVNHLDLIAESAEELADQIDVSAVEFNQDELEKLFGIEISL